MINSKTGIIGLIGHPVGHSLSPQMHNRMFKALNIDYRYVAFDVEESNLEDAIKGIKALNIRGANITIPHKVNVMKYLDIISSEAKAIGAVNTIVNQNGTLIGHNTDGEGYVRSLIEETKIDLTDKGVIILGAGGAAKAISYTLGNYPLKEIIICNRNREKSMKIKNNLEIDALAIDYDEIIHFIKKADIIINTTSVGMTPNLNQSLIKKEWIQSHQVVSDIVYNPLETKLLKDASSRGATVHSGLGMFIYQGVFAFEKWTEISPDPELMKNSVLDAIQKD